MIPITSKQAKFIRENSPTSVIVVTNRFASRKEKKTYVAEETTTVKKLLDRFSKEIEIVTETYGEV